MKKKAFILIGAFAVLVALIGIYFAVKGKSDTAEEEKETLIGLTANRIQTISWTPEGGDTLSFSRIDGRWSYDGDRDFNVDQNAMNTLCSGVTGITVYQTLENVSDLSQYGLDDPEYTLQVTDTEGNVTEVAIGDTNDAVNSLYAYKNGDNTRIYSVMASLKTAIAKQLSDLEAAEDSSGEEHPDTGDTDK